jgi:hypothetical protein
MMFYVLMLTAVRAFNYFDGSVVLVLPNNGVRGAIAQDGQSLYIYLGDEDNQTLVFGNTGT